MTVWTDVSLNEVNDWLEERDLGCADDISPVEEGVEDSVFRLDMTDGSRACLRLFERTEALGPLTLVRRLAARGLPTCPPMEDASNRVIVPLKGKPAALFPWIDGACVAVPSLAQIEAIGTFMGLAAREGLSLCKDWRRENPCGWPWFEDTAARVCDVLAFDLRIEIEEEMAAQRDFWDNGAGGQIPRGPVHGDLFCNNVMFKPDGTLGAVIDWGFCASDTPLLYDLAIAVNDWCLKEGSVDLDEKKLEVFLRAREAVMPLCDAEKKAWSMALRLAALRFYLSRLYDKHWPRDPSGKVLDPDYFCKILRARKA